MTSIILPQAGQQKYHRLAINAPSVLRAYRYIARCRNVSLPGILAAAYNNMGDVYHHSHDIDLVSTLRQ